MEKVSLYDAEARLEHVLWVSHEDAERCQTDALFASSLLVYAQSQTAENENHPKGECELLPPPNNLLLENASDGSTIMEEEDTFSHAERSTTTTESSTWLHRETLALITVYEQHIPDFSSAKKRKSVWQDISNELKNLGVIHDAKRCEMKWRNLLRTYKTVKDNKKKTGRGASKFFYFDRIDAVIGKKPAVDCNHTFSSTPCSSSVVASQNEKQLDVSVEESSEKAEQPFETINKKGVLEKPYEKKRKILELLNLKVNYIKNKEIEQKERNERKARKLVLQEKLLEVEQRKLALLERVLQ